MLIRTAMPLAALLLLAGMPQTAIQAKPPGLPVNQKDACLEKSPQQEIHSEPAAFPATAASAGTSAKPAGTILFEFGIDSATGLFAGMAAGQSSSAPESSSLQQLVEGWNLLFGFLGGSTGSLGVEITAELPLERLSGAPHCVPPSDCPFVQARAQKPLTNAAPMAAGVLENLGKIEAARTLYDQAEKERCAGHFDAACRKYAEVQKLCPGSRFDEQATGRLAELQAAQATGGRQAGAEEEEDPPCDWWPKGVGMHCKFRLFGLNTTMNLKRDGHGSVSFGYEMTTWLAWDSALMPLFNVGP